MYALNVKSFRSKTVTETKCRSLALISNSKIRLIEHGLKNVPRAYSVKKLYKFYKKVKFEEKSHKSSRSYGIQANEMIYRNVNAILFSNISRKRNNLTRLSCLHSTFWKIPSQHLRHYNDGLKKFTEISNDHLTPELSLHLITPNCEIWHSPATKFHFDNDPFWAIYWPGGQALSRFLLK